MEIKQTAMAGTLESSDVQVTLHPSTTGLTIDISSDVKKQFGAQIEKTVREVLARFDIDKADVSVIDKGALDIVIKARTIAAVGRALALKEPKWEVL